MCYSAAALPPPLLTTILLLASYRKDTKRPGYLREHRLTVCEFARWGWFGLDFIDPAFLNQSGRLLLPTTSTSALESG